MRLSTRLRKLEREAVPTTPRPALLFLTGGGLRDAQNRPVEGAPRGVKVIIGVDPRDV